MRKKQLLPKLTEVPHTADVAIEVLGDSLDELFVNAAYGMLSIMEIKGQEKNIGREKILLAEYDYESLLVAFLSEILFMVEQKRNPFNIQVKISGSQLESTFQSFSIISYVKEIKAVTFNQLNIKQTNSQLKTRIVFDI